jgi:hypothetical protein
MAAITSFRLGSDTPAASFPIPCESVARRINPSKLAGFGPGLRVLAATADAAGS